jgi:PmbA protein
MGHRRGNASTSDFSEAAIEQTVQAAYDIARFTAEDPVAGLPDAGRHRRAKDHPDLDLFHPWDVDSEQAAKLALACEARGLRHRQAHHQQRRRGRLGAAEPFLQRPHARLPRRLCQLAAFDLGGADRRQGRRHAARRLVQLDALGRRTGQPGGGGPLRRRARAGRLKSRKIATRECPVLFESPLAAGLLGGYVQATSGGSLYRKSTFLLDSLGKQVFPSTSTCRRPARHARQGQRALRRRGRAHPGAQGGRCRPGRGLLPVSYSARKLGMKTTGNAGGSHNLTLARA